MFQQGEIVHLTYPRCTLVEAVTTHRLRSIRIERVRDLIAEPLTPHEYLRRTKQRRSRWLIYGIDLATGQRRKFYLGSSREHTTAGTLRLALYGSASKPVDIISREFGPTSRDRIVLARIVCRWLERDLGDLKLAIISDDFRLIA